MSCTNAHGYGYHGLAKMLTTDEAPRLRIFTGSSQDLHKTVGNLVVFYNVNIAGECKFLSNTHGPNNYFANA